MPRQPLGEDALLLGYGLLQQVGLALLAPFPRCQAIADGRVEIIGRHGTRRLSAAEIVARPIQADLGDGIDRARNFAGVYAARAALAMAQHVVVDDQA